MSQPIQVELISDDEEDDHNHNNNKSLTTPCSSNLKRPRTSSTESFQQNTTNPVDVFIIDDDPTPQKFKRRASFTPSVVQETPLSEMPKSLGPAIFRGKMKDAAVSSSGSPSKFPGTDELICLETDGEADEGLKWGDRWNSLKPCTSYDEEMDSERSSKFTVKDKLWEDEELSGEFLVEKSVEKISRSINSTYNLDKEDADGLGMGNWLNNGGRSFYVDAEKGLDKSSEVVTEKPWESRAFSADLDVEYLDKSPKVVHSTFYLGNQNSTKTYNSIHLEDDIDHMLPFHDHDKENVGLKEDDVICKPKDRGKAKVNRKNNDEQARNRRKSQEEKARLMAEKKLKKEQEKLEKAALKAEAGRLKQLEKDKQRWEKEAEKIIMAEIDAKVIELGSIGGPLISKFGEKGLRFIITSNKVARSIVWRLTVPKEISELSSITTDIPYVLLIYDAEEFCKVATDGSVMDHISSLRTKYPSSTICCLTNRLMSYINKRDQDKYKNRKNASDWQRPPVEQVFAKLTTHFTNVHSRQCADEAELAEHVAGLTINLAKCRFRKKLTALSVNANGGNVPKDCVGRDQIMRNPWLKALISIPKVQPRFALAIGKKYPTMKSLLSVYMDPNKSVHEKEFLLKDLTTDGLGSDDRRVGEICSKRVYRILMAQNGSFKTDDVETGADYFTTMR